VIGENVAIDFNPQRIYNVIVKMMRGEIMKLCIALAGIVDENT
jgi:hypothetical protein